MNLIRFRNRYLGIADVILLCLASYVSFVLRLEKLNLGEHWRAFVLFTVLAIIVFPLGYAVAGVYSRYWHYASIEELLLLAGATTIAMLVTAALSIAADDFLAPRPGVPRSIPFIFLLLALLSAAGPRMLLRIAASRAKKHTVGLHLRRFLIMGAGAAGSMIARELQTNLQLGMQVVGFLDDDTAKRNVHIRGVKVLGTRRDIPHLAQSHHIDSVIIAMPTAPGKEIRDIVHICEEAGVETKIIPGMYEVLGGKVNVSQLRSVQIEDLLRREPVQTDTAAVSALIRGKRVLVTGAGGSIGSELCRQVLRADPDHLILLGHGENSIFAIDAELCKMAGLKPANGRNAHNARNAHNGRGTPQITPVIGDIRSVERMNAVFREFRPDIVFHAAAHKHVPLMEMNPAETITNNILGTRNLVDAALASGVDHFVMVSTDKAVNPTSVMGASKRVAELLVHEVALQSGKAYLAVRFGNVLASRGSVVLTFKQQISEGGPVTVTHEEMVRYFMTIPEAVQLVLQAATLGSGGEVFMLDMGEPVKIIDLARDLIELSGYQVGRDIDIQITGTRPGEKLYEEMFLPGEDYKRTQHEKIFSVNDNSRFVPSHLHEAIDRLKQAAEHDNKRGIMAGLRELVPGFRLIPAVPVEEYEGEPPVEAVISDLLPMSRKTNVGRGHAHASD